MVIIVLFALAVNFVEHSGERGGLVQSRSGQ